MKPHSPQLLVVPFNQATAKARQETCAANLKISTEFTNSIGMQLRLIPPGEFLMGSTKDQIEKVLSWGGLTAYLSASSRPAACGLCGLSISASTKSPVGSLQRLSPQPDTRPKRSGTVRPPDQEFGEAKGENVDWLRRIPDRGTASSVLYPVAATKFKLPHVFSGCRERPPRHWQHS